MVSSCDETAGFPDIVCSWVTTAFGRGVAETVLVTSGGIDQCERGDLIGTSTGGSIGHSGVLVVVCVTPELAHSRGKSVTGDHRFVQNRCRLGVTSEMVCG